MAKKTKSRIDELRGASRLAIEATRAVTDLVQAMHVNIGGGPALLGKPLEGPVRLLTAPVYGAIRGVTALVGAGIDAALAELAPLAGGEAQAHSPEADGVLAALNGVLGDYLLESSNPLAIDMGLYLGGRRLELEREALKAEFPRAGGRLVVLVHGSCMNDRRWSRLGHDHGAQLERDLGNQPLYLRYNSGLHISLNGRALSDLLEDLVAAWPAPIEELAIIGHSMGGLVARSACHYGQEARRAWRSKLKTLVTLGSPHHGAPLERAGNWVEVFLGISRYSVALGRLGRIRSAGVTDLRYGNVLDEHWKDVDRFGHGGDVRSALKLPDGVACYAIAATLAREPGGRLPGDGLVPVDSALGRHRNPDLNLAFPDSHQWIGYGMGHLDLLNAPDVYATIRSWLA